MSRGRGPYVGVIIYINFKFIKKGQTPINTINDIWSVLMYKLLDFLSFSAMTT